MSIRLGKFITAFILVAFLINTSSPIFLVFGQDSSAEPAQVASTSSAGNSNEVTTENSESKTEQPVEKTEESAKEPAKEPGSKSAKAKPTQESLQKAATTAAATTNDPGPGEVKAPDNPINSNASYQTSLFTGSATYDYSIPVPPGTAGMTPSVGLSYNSGSASGKSGIVGLGWDLNLSYVYRDINFTPTNTADDKFKVILNGSSYDLVYDSASQTYKTKVQTDILIKKLTGGSNRYGEYWQIKTKDGTEYKFGLNVNSEIKCESVASPRPWSVRNYARRWNLDEITDVNGNKIFYTYLYGIDANDWGASYLSKIEYNTEKSRRIEFEYESTAKPDLVTSYEQGGCRVKESRRLSKIKTFTSNQLFMSYNLAYIMQGSSKSLLSSITQVDKNGLALPATQFEYNQLINGFDTTLKQLSFTGFEPPKEWKASNRLYNQVRFMDVNRDFLPDYIKSVGDHSNTPIANRNWEVYLNNGSGWNNKQIWAPYGVSSLDDGTKDNTNNTYLVELLDMNLDGLPDIYVVDSVSNMNKTPYNGLWFHINNGTNFNSVPNSITSSWGANFHTNMADYVDFNNDNLLDYIRNGCFFNTGCEIKFNQNQSFSADTQINQSSNFDVNKGLAIDIDVNGDSLQDIVEVTDKTWKVYLSNGLGWENGEIWQNGVVKKAWDCTQTCVYQPSLQDMDGDGLPDIVDIAGTNYNELRVYKNTGNSWNTTYSIWSTAGNAYTMTNSIKNVDYDSLPEIGYVTESNTTGGIYSYYDNLNTAPLLLKKITNPLGGTTEIEYTPSTKYDNTGGDGISDLGFPVMTVSKIKEDNKLSGTDRRYDETTYTYKNGMYDYQDREFRGFAQVTVTNSEGTKVEHNFYQDDALKGMESSTVVKASNGNMYSMVSNSYSSALANGIYTNRLISTDAYTYDAVTANPKRTTIAYEYDQYGNVTREINKGDSSVTDEINTTTTYVYNTTAWILDKPKNVVVRLGETNTGTKLKEVLYYYDMSNDNNAAPTKGLLTKEEHWNNTGTNIVQRYEYNSFGNVTKAYDPLSRTTTIAYDSTNTFATSTTNVKNQTSSATYHAPTGNKLTETDPNGYVKSYEYDTFGRILKEIMPYDTSANPTVLYQYTTDGVAPEAVKVSKREVAGQAGTIDAYTFVDGFGRVVQTRTEAEDATKQIVTNFMYNGFGKVSKQVLPHLENTNTNYVQTPTGLNTVSITFDPAGRATRVTSPDGKFQTFAYDHWKLTLTDANGHSKKQYMNAYNQITKIEEMNSGVTYTTNYQYQFPGGAITNSTDTRGSQIKFEYDSLGRNTKLIDHTLGTWIYTYDAAGNMVSQKDNRNVTITTTYDELNRPTLINYPTDADFNYIYDREVKGTLSEINTTVSPTQKVKYTYDQRLRVIKEDLNIVNTSPSFNKSFITETTYDSADRVKSIKYPSGETVNYTFNTQGQIETMGSLLTNVNYNELNKITLKAFGNGVNTNYTYDNLTTRLNEIKTMKTASLQNFKYTYDSVGNINSIQDVIKATTQAFTYDDLDRLKTASEAGTGGYNHVYTYDAVGNILKVVTEQGTMNYFYEDTARPNVLTKIENVPSTTPTPTPTPAASPTATPTLPPAGSCSGITVGKYCAEYFENTNLSGTPKVKQIENSPINYVWASGVAPTGLTVNDSFTARWAGDFNFSAGNYIFTIRGDDRYKVWIDGVVLIDKWDTNDSYWYRDIPKTMTAGNHNIKVEYLEWGGEARIEFSWAVQAAASSMMSLQSTGTGATMLAAPSVTASPTPTSNNGYLRLTTESDRTNALKYAAPTPAPTPKVTPTVSPSVTPTKVVSPTVTPKPSVTVTPTVTPKTTVAAKGVMTQSMTAQFSAGTKQYTYDANGNLVSDNQFCYTYNDANKVKVVRKCTGSVLVAEYFYNAAGQRLMKKVYNNGVLTHTLITVNDLYDLKINANGSEEATTYYRANNEMIAKKVGTTITYHHNDHLNSASIVTNTTGAIVEETRYYPYGGTRSGGSESKTGRYTYTDQESDNETGLMYYGARYYNASIGRFVQPDSMLPDIYDPQQLNRYAYVRNNPLKYVDPSGHAASAVVMRALKYLAVHAGTDFAADVAVQTVFDYYFNSETDSWGEAFGNVDYGQALKSGAEGMIPVKSMKARLGKAFLTASGDVGMNAMKGNYSSEQAFQDFAIGVIGDLSGQGLNKIITKYGLGGVVKGFQKLGFDNNYIKKATGFDADAVKSNINDWFRRKGGSSAINHTITLNNDGTTTAYYDVPAKDIPGSYARYYKVVGADGVTKSVYKDTYAPDGSLVHRKHK